MAINFMPIWQNWAILHITRAFKDGYCSNNNVKRLNGNDPSTSYTNLVIEILSSIQ